MSNWPRSVNNPVWQGDDSPVLPQVADLYPARFYAQIDSSQTPAPVTGWWDIWGMSDIGNLPAAAVLIPMTQEQWDYHLQTDGNGACTHLSPAVENREFIDYTPPPPPPPPLREQAQAALAEARQYVSENYTMLNEPTPLEWVGYLKKLMAISSGRDTVSKALPIRPDTD